MKKSLFAATIAVICAIGTSAVAQQARNDAPTARKPMPNSANAAADNAGTKPMMAPTRENRPMMQKGEMRSNSGMAGGQMGRPNDQMNHPMPPREAANDNQDGNMPRPEMNGGMPPRDNRPMPMNGDRAQGGNPEMREKRQEMRQEIKQERMENRQEMQQQRQENRQEIMQKKQEMRQEIRQERMENRQEKRELKK